MNPYYECISNKYIDGSLCTILCNLDYLNISHVESKVFDRIINMLNEKNVKDVPLTITWEKFHDYLGMTIYIYRM